MKNATAACSGAFGRGDAVDRVAPDLTQCGVNSQASAVASFAAYDLHRPDTKEDTLTTQRAQDRLRGLPGNDGIYLPWRHRLIVADEE